MSQYPISKENNFCLMVMISALPQLSHLLSPKATECNAFIYIDMYVPNNRGKIGSKWRKNVSDKYEVCGETETTKHMLFEC